MSLQILGYPSSWRYPFAKAQIKFNQGPSSAAAGQRKILVVAPMTSAATWTVNTPYDVTSEDVARLGAGAGSPLHRIVRAILRANKGAKITGVGYAATSGGTPAAADATVIVAFGSGSNPTSTGKLTLYVCGDVIEVAYGTADTATTIGDNIEAAINARTYLPLTASNAAGTVTLTAKISGASQGDGTVGVLRLAATVDSGTNVTITPEAAALGLGTGTDGAEGTTTEIANATAALATLTTRDDYYIVTSAWSATGLAPFKAHVAAKNEPNPGIECCLIAGYTGTLPACSTIATGINSELVQILWQKNSEHDPAELAGQMAGILQKYEEIDPTVNLNGHGDADWFILPARAASDWPTGSELNDAVIDGISPVEPVNSIRTRLGMNITTRSKDSGGTLNDFRSAERHRVSGMHHVSSTVKLRYGLTYAGKKLSPDRIDPQTRKVDPNQKLRPGVVTPSNFAPFLRKMFKEFEDASIIVSADEFNDSLIVEIDPQNNARLQCAFSGSIINHLNQASFLISETNSG